MQTLRLWSGIIVGTIAILLCGFSGFSQRTPKAPSLCYAFLRDGNLRIMCQGKDEAIQTGGSLTDFAISRDGSHVALESRDSADKFLVRTVSLETGQLESARTVEILYLMSTCGELVGIELGTDQRWNLVTWSPEKLSDYKFYLCSSDRQVVAGWTGSDEENSRSPSNPFRAIRLHVRHRTEDIQWTIEQPLEFDVSQNGAYIAYFTRIGGDPKICIRDWSSEKCVHEQGGRIVVSNSGEVLYISEEGLKYWRSGIGTPVILSKVGNIESAQWITPQVASELQGLATKMLPAESVKSVKRSMTTASQLLKNLDYAHLPLAGET